MKQELTDLAVPSVFPRDDKSILPSSVVTLHAPLWSTILTAELGPTADNSSPIKFRICNLTMLTDSWVQIVSNYSANELKPAWELTQQSMTFNLYQLYILLKLYYHASQGKLNNLINHIISNLYLLLWSVLTWHSDTDTGTPSYYLLLGVSVCLICEYLP